MRYAGLFTALVIIYGAAALIAHFVFGWQP